MSDNLRDDSPCDGCLSYGNVEEMLIDCPKCKNNVFGEK